MKITVLIPAHNEEKNIRTIIERTNTVLKKCRYNHEIIAIDDNSDDETGKILDKLAKKNKRLKIIHKKNPSTGPSGLGSALIAGFKECSGDVIIPLMGDLSDNPSDIPKFVEKINEGYDVVCGSRFIKGAYLKDYPKTKFLINRLWNKVFSFLFRLGIKDISNAFKTYRKEVIIKTKPKSKGFDITAEIVLKAHILNFKITEIPVSWHGRIGGKSKFGSFSFFYTVTKVPKIGYQYGMLALRLWFKFLSRESEF